MAHHIGLYFASHHGQTRAIAAHIGRRLAKNGCDVTIIDLEGDSRTRPSLHEFDTVLIGAPLYIRRYPSAVTHYIRSHLTDLRRHPSTGFFSVCLTAALGTPEAYIESLGPLREFLSDIDWTPDWIASFGGALRYRQYDPLTRWILRRIAAHYHYSTDTSRDHDLTSWETVERFADHVFQNVALSQFRSGSLSLPSRTLDRVMPAFGERVTERVTVDATPDEIGATIDRMSPGRHTAPHEVTREFVGQFDHGRFSLSPARDEAAFVAFHEPGHDKIVTDIWFDDAGERGTVVRAESRIQPTSWEAQPWFGWHAFLLSRGLRRYLRRLLSTIRQTVEHHHDARTEHH
jgi:menaquinone-dependent protoporphyrinogen oxidase